MATVTDKYYLANARMAHDDYLAAWNRCFHPCCTRTDEHSHTYPGLTGTATIAYGPEPLPEGFDMNASTFDGYIKNLRLLVAANCAGQTCDWCDGIGRHDEGCVHDAAVLVLASYDVARIGQGYSKSRPQYDPFDGFKAAGA